MVNHVVLCLSRVQNQMLIPIVFVFIALVQLNVSLVSAKYYIIDPLSNTTWRAGGQASVRWQLRGEVSKNPTVSLELIAGAGANAKWVDTLCDQISNYATNCQFTVPDYLPTMPSGYLVRINYRDGATPNFDYSGRFQIIGKSTGNDNKPPRRPSPTACITCNAPPGTDLSRFKDVMDPNSSTASLLSFGALQLLVTLFSVLIISIQ